MKILMVNYEYPPLGGGGGVIHQHISEDLAKRHDVAVVTTAYGDLPMKETIRGVAIHRVKVIGRSSLTTASLPSMLSFYRACVRGGQKVIDKFRPEVINTHFAIPTGPSGVKLAKDNQLPHALCIHGGDIFDPSKKLSPHRIPGLRGTVKRVLFNSDRVLAQSQNTADNAKRFYGYDKPIEIIPHGIPEPILPPFDRSDLGLPSDHVILVTLGRLIARKANHELLQVFARLDDRRTTLVLVGDGPEYPRLKSMAEQLNVSQRVHFVGLVSEERKLQFLQAADLFVSTTLHEGFGLMFLEAMFCGLPIVTYDHGGQRDFLVDDKTGYLVPLHDQQLFGARLDTLVRDAQRRATMRNFNLELAHRYSIENCAAQYEATFEDMLTGVPPSLLPHETVVARSNRTVAAEKTSASILSSDKPGP